MAVAVVWPPWAETRSCASYATVSSLPVIAIVAVVPSMTGGLLWWSAREKSAFTPAAGPVRRTTSTLSGWLTKYSRRNASAPIV